MKLTSRITNFQIETILRHKPTIPPKYVQGFSKSLKEDPIPIVLFLKDQMVYKCSYCKFKNQSRILLKHHLSVHTNKLPLKCKNCVSSFLQLNCLKRHVFYECRFKMPKQRTTQAASICQKRNSSPNYRK